MSDELRAAAEYLLNPPFVSEFSKYLDCAQKIGHAYLAEHPADVPNDSLVGCKIVAVGSDNSILVDSPSGSRRRVWMVEKHPADDDDPVTYDWICGLLPICRKFSGLMLAENLRILNSSKGWGVYFAHEDLEGFELVCRVSTRRQVRDLVRALNGGE